MNICGHMAFQKYMNTARGYAAQLLSNPATHAIQLHNNLQNCCNSHNPTWAVTTRALFSQSREKLIQKMRDRYICNCIRDVLTWHIQRGNSTSMLGTLGHKASL